MQKEKAGLNKQLKKLQGKISNFDTHGNCPMCGKGFRHNCKHSYSQVISHLEDKVLSIKIRKIVEKVLEEKEEEKEEEK